MNLVATEDKLTQFKDWWMANRNLRVPFDSPVVVDAAPHVDVSVWGAVLYRAGCWQVQLFILKPNCVVPEHRHPNVDSYEVFLSGDVEFTLDAQIAMPMGLSAVPGFDGHHEMLGTHIRVAPGMWHGATSGAKGGLFLSIQQWLNNVPPTNVGDDWEHRG